MPEEILIEWRAYTHHHKPKSVRWYQYMLYIAAGIFVISLFMQNYLFSFFVLCAVAVLFLVAVKEPIEESYALTTRGVRAGNVLYPHHHLEAYILHDHHEFPTIILQSHKTFSPHIIIPLGDLDHNTVHEYFHARNVPHLPHERGLVDWVADRIGF